MEYTASQVTENMLWSQRSVVKTVLLFSRYVGYRHDSGTWHIITEIRV